MKRIVFALLFVPLLSTLYAQSPYDSSIRPAVAPVQLPINRGSMALWQSLKKLHTRASLIMVTAHPDDEDGGMLTYESRGQGARVTLLTLNRGEGGANVMSSNYFDGLGLVRTEELLAAGRYYGVDQYWTRVIDYGFSKTKAESISKWTHDRVLYDVVTAPALWLAIGAGWLVQLASARSLRRSTSTDAALALVLSSLPYSFAYLIIGVATESRYLFWSLIAIFAALVISAPELRMPLGRHHRMRLQD